MSKFFVSYFDFEFGKFKIITESFIFSLDKILHEILIIYFENPLKAWENVKLQLDDTVLFKILNQHSFVFGNLKTNSDVFIGGIPKDIHLLGVMSSPLKRYTTTFAGGVKNILYRLDPQGFTSPQLIQSVGMRQSDDDYCSMQNLAEKKDSFCQNGGICYNTNEGPKCDCSFTDFHGRHCDKARLDSELSFYGQEWIGYDISNYSAAVIRIRSENIVLSFKTIDGHASLYVGGDRQVCCIHNCLI
ncbi:unnamed protein product [Thelazia callipaeda]|uniref:EGF-like domain-containing protein n=1 Tax=Thelazia callipaeda TaxID=103827 RepID=A0A3P7KPP7_THECL|nr:unnamed protein product [Thelazia callipaeda]